MPFGEKHLCKIFKQLDKNYEFWGPPNVGQKIIASELWLHGAP